jgi:phosphatidylserine/phosphatidylglycerophosphate/cardiolipin synthase-like enzyme
MSDPIDETSAALDLLELIDPALPRAGVELPADRGLEAVISTLSQSGDRSTRAAISALLRRLGLRPETLTPEMVGLVNERIRSVAAVRDQVRMRTPPASSSLVVTASGSSLLHDLRRELALVPLFQLVEDVVRSASDVCWLGAPYWNSDAIDRLLPALNGFARRGGHISFVCQGLPTAPNELDPLPLLCRAARDFESEGGSAAVWGFTARATTNEPVLLHAKFALGDGRLGYLGSANITRQGFDSHFEIGARLGPAEVTDLLALLGRLIELEVLVQSAS